MKTLLLIVLLPLTLSAQVSRFVPSNTIIKLNQQDVGESVASRLHYFKVQVCNNQDVIAQKTNQFIRIIHEYVGTPTYKNEYNFTLPEIDKLIQIIKYILSIPKSPFLGSEVYRASIDHYLLPKGVTMLIIRSTQDDVATTLFLAGMDLEGSAIINMNTIEIIALYGLLEKARAFKW